MNFRTSYLVGLMASALLVFTVTPLVQTAFAAEPLKITGPNGEVRQTNRQYGPTRSSDTFWSIAQKVRPDNVSIYQVMAAIYDANPHAFSNANFNSLEKGMILLIPSKDLMLAIPKSMAKARAERDDKGWKKMTQPKVVQATQATTGTPVRPVTLPITPADTSAAQKPAANQDLTELTANLDAAEAKNLQLTDELARAQDQLALGDSDTETLKNKIAELNEQVAILEEQLQASKLQGAGLTEEVKFLQEQVNALQTAEPEEDTDLWRNLMSNPLMLIAAISIPALLLLLLLWLFLRRRRDEGAGTDEQTAKKTEAEDTSAPNAPAEAEVIQAAAGEDLETMAVHLDSQDDDSIDSLMNIDTAELQPEVDLAADMFVDLGETSSEEEPVEEEGQSLDDLWAEAMGEQDEEEAKAGADDLDSLLAGFDAAADTASNQIVTEAESQTETQSDLVAEDDLDSLLAGFDAAADTASNQIVTEAESQTETQSDLVAEDDLDSLLAGFDAAADTASNQIVTEAESQTETQSDLVAEDDLDSLLAGFDAAADTASNQIVTEAESQTETQSDLVAEDDLDSLLAGFDAAADTASNQIVTEAESQTETQSDLVAEDDLDSLLAGFDAAADVPSDDAANLAEEIAAELEQDVTMTAEDDTPGEELVEKESADKEGEEDLDALLAGFDAPAPDTRGETTVEEVDLSEAISAELEGEVETSKPDSEDDLESLLAEFDIADTDIVDRLDKAEILDDSLLEPSPEREPSGDDALDSLLADLEAVDPKAGQDPVASKAAGGMFADLKGGKKVDNSLDWESSADVQDPVIAPASNDELLSPSSEAKVADSETSLNQDDEEKLTVDEALAALDAKEVSKSPAFAVPEHDLTSFQKDNGFIDIDRLLNEADEEVVDMDKYKELDVDMGELDSLMGNPAMVDVDDEENSVNAKLDLARAYIEIDDNDSAKALLKEVLLDGNDRQKEEANGLINSLD
ncbi:FimV N-terminal domain [Shewanella benthica]|uniref:FimV N-terminal domain n=1 Tax=Shewanella benthica TaxID=43661 RepID=A0A330M434_9GAMM|nr:FimV/HubP family polar landmark protein [Shewanella benthica]SQH76203.1 FimV N-terminal domain [Shewanella benthica]